MYSAIAANKRNSVLIMALFVAIIGALGWIFSSLYGDPMYFYLIFVGSGVYALIQYFAASQLALSLNGAHEVTKREAPKLYRTVENISIATGLPMPKVYIIDDPAPNAFATGRDPNHAVVAATSGLVDIMTDTELEAVIAHEMGHIKNYDIRLSMIVFGLVSAIGLIADIFLHFMWVGGDRRENNYASPAFIILGLVAGIIAPFVALLVQLAISRQREYLADSTGALTTRYPEGLISALQKIGNHGSSLKRQNTATAHLFFANPLKGQNFAKLFSTHPPIADRIARLKAMGDKL